MHKSSMFRMKWFVDNYTPNISKHKIKVLDVGSYDINGSYKKLFLDEKFEYIGLDMEKGPNVDIILKNPYDWSELETDSYDILISGQTFEHTEFFWITISEMTRVLKKDGLICLIAPNQASEHRHPVDCYRFFSDGMIALARYVNLEPLHAHTNCAPKSNQSHWFSETNADTLMIAKKPYEGNTQYVDLKTYKCIPPNQEHFRTVLLPYKRKTLSNVLRKALKQSVKFYTFNIFKDHLFDLLKSRSKN